MNDFTEAMIENPVQDRTSTASVIERKASQKLVYMDLDEQRERLLKANQECQHRMSQSHNSSNNGNTSTLGCEMVWDNILCWDEAPPGTMQQHQCPDYINGFDIHETATKICMPNGTWYKIYENGKHWTNYTACHNAYNVKMEGVHGERLTLIQTIGYGVSLCSLVIALIIMFSSRLKSKSNTLHVNLFMAFILRASFSFAQRLLFVNGLGLHKDVEIKSDGTVSFIHPGMHWECRLLQTTFMYTICASHMWIFVEGLYLHMLIYRTLSTERNGVRPYIILGWVLPVVVIITWVFVKALADNTLCWNVSSNLFYIWILHGPMLATVILNFVFFLNISRVLCSRVRSSQRHVGRSKYRHLVKFILVLIPLFGVFYIVLAIAFPLGYAKRFDINQMYVEQTYNSFQGFILALLFCFLNEEVHSEIKRIWWRSRTWKRDSVVTRSFVMSSFKRNSCYNQTPLNMSQSLRAITGFTSTDNAEIKKPIWFNRLKMYVLRCLRLEHGSDRGHVDSPTQLVSEQDTFYLTSQNISDDETERRTKYRDSKDNPMDEDGGYAMLTPNGT